MNWRDELATLTAAGLEPRYPWSSWFDGGTHRLVRGADFHCSPQDFYSNAFRAAQRRGLRMRGKCNGDEVTLVVLPALNPVVRIELGEEVA